MKEEEPYRKEQATEILVNGQLSREGYNIEDMRGFGNKEARMREQEAIEAERKSHAFRDFFELTEEQTDFFRERVAASSGHVRIVVHPSERWLPYAPENKRNRQEWDGHRRDAISQALLKWADSKPEDSPPIIIFEEEDQIEDLKTRLERQSELKNQFYIVPTFSLWSDIKLSSDEQRGKADHWGEAIQKLEGLGVTNVIVGGNYLRVYDDPSHEGGRFLSACVGNVANRLSPKFNVELSHLSYPDSRKKLKEIETRRGAHET